MGSWHGHILSGGDRRHAAVVDPTFQALRISPRPKEARGHYRVATATVAGGVYTGGAFFSVRWTESKFALVLNGIAVTFVATSVQSVADLIHVDAVVARNFTLADSGGTTIALTRSQYARSSMPPSLVADMRIATTADLTAGTKVLDAQAFAFSPMPLSSQIVGVGCPVELYQSLPGMHPITLGPNEGMSLRATGPTGGITGSFGMYYVNFDWSEVPAP